MKKLLFALFAIIILHSPAVFAGHGPEGNHEQHALPDEDMTLKVHGLVCDFCAQAILKVFLRHDAVNDVQVHLDHMEIHLDLKDGETMSEEQLDKMVTDAGYTLVEVIEINNEDQK